MNKILLLISCLSFLFSEQKILWDLGVTIKNEKNENAILKPLISNTQIAPTYTTAINNKQLLDLSITSLLPKHIIQLLYISDRYFELSKYIENLSDEYLLSDDEIIIYADALYRLGIYNDAISNLNQVSKNYPNDEKYFTLALYNKRNGTTKMMVSLLDDLIANYPNSEYAKLAKLQLNRLR